jgi:hypothetical protein
LRLEGSSRSGIIVSQSLGIFTDAVKATHIIRKVLLRQIDSLGAVLLVLAFAGASPSFAWSENNCGHTCNEQHPQDKDGDKHFVTGFRAAY